MRGIAAKLTENHKSMRLMLTCV